MSLVREPREARVSPKRQDPAGHTVSKTTSWSAGEFLNLSGCKDQSALGSRTKGGVEKKGNPYDWWTTRRYILGGTQGRKQYHRTFGGRRARLVSDPRFVQAQVDTLRDNKIARSTCKTDLFKVMKPVIGAMK